jgi:hypothetical protein
MEVMDIEVGSAPQYLLQHEQMRAERFHRDLT